MLETAAETAPVADPLAEVDELEQRKKRVEKVRARVSKAIQLRDDRLPSWKESVQARIGKSLDSVSDDTVQVPADWSRTKSKQAQLFFQVPHVGVRPLQPQYESAAPAASAALNWTLKHDVKAHRVMDEVLADVINAAGIGVCMIGYEAQFETVQVPARDLTALGLTPEQQQMAIDAGLVEMKPVERTLYECYYANRISPQYFLYPPEFTGSDFQDASWLGWEGWIPKAEAVRKGWVDENFDAGDSQPDFLTDDQSDRKSDDKFVHFFEILEKAAVYDPAEKHPEKLRRMVLIDGKDDDFAVNEDFKWQKYDPATRKFLGLRSFPFKVLTLTYVSDMAVPPSDSEIGRPQVREMNLSRSQMVRQRRHSTPVRWFDVNMVDEDIAEQLRKGVWQDFIPMNGPGDRAIGEVARANYPRENFQFYEIVNADLDEAWSQSANQQGLKAQGDTSATEAQIMQSNATLRIDYERGRVLRFFQEIAEGIFALMQLFQTDERYAETIGPDATKKLVAWDRTKIAGDFIFEIAPDASQRIDVNKRKQDLQQLYTLVRQDPQINSLPILREWLALNNIDPKEGVKPPQDPPPDKINIGYSFKGEDLLNPFAVAIMQKEHRITPEQIKEAKMIIIEAAGEELPPDVVPGGEAGAPPATPEATPHVPHGGMPPRQEPLTKRFPDGSPAV